MRKHQISVRAYRMPKGHESMTEEELRKFKLAGAFDTSAGIEVLRVYADANSFYEAFCAAYNETVMEIKRLGGFAELSEEVKERFTDKKEVDVAIHFSELLNPNLGSIGFSSISENIYEALADSFNDVLYEVQKHVDLPTFGRKEHYTKQSGRFSTEETVLDFVFTDSERLTGPDVAIPEGYLHIAERVFYDREDIVGVTLPDGITQIRSEAFRKCKNLRSINLPDTLRKIGSSAFQGCKSLVSVNIPKGVTVLYRGTFLGCGSLQEISLPKGETEIRGQVFGFCESLKEVTIPAGTKLVDAEAFTGCAALENIFVEPGNAAYTDVDGVLYNKDRTELIRYPEGKTQKSFNIPDSVKEIGCDAFSGCKHLETIYIPAELTQIGFIAFSVWHSPARKGEVPEHVQEYDGVARLVVDGQNSRYSDIDGVLFNKDKSILIKYPKGRSQSDYTIPDGVKEIARRAFEYCRSLNVVTMPATITAISSFAFSGCSGLERINIPENTQSVGRGCFWECPSLGDITVAAQDAVFGESVFEDTAWYAAQPDGLIYVGNTAYTYKGEMPENSVIRIKGGTKRIAPSAFVHCRNLTGVTIPRSVIEIGSSAFACCYSLSDITLEHSGVQIAEDAFSDTAYERGEIRPDVLFAKQRDL